MQTPRQKNKPIPPASPRTWLSAVRNIVGKDFFKSLFCIHERTATRWIAQRPYVAEESVRSNYLENHETLIVRLMDDGYSDLARAIVSRHAELTGCTLTSLEPPEPDKETIEEEMLDDYPELVRLHQAIQDGEDLDAVNFLANQIVAEIHETVELYRTRRK